MLGAWLAEIASQYRVTLAKSRSGARCPLVVAFLVAMPLVHLTLGWAADALLSLATDGRIAPLERAEAPKEAVAG